MIFKIKGINLRILLLLMVLSQSLIAESPVDSKNLDYQIHTLRLAITDLNDTFGAKYPNGTYYLEKLDEIEKQYRAKQLNVAEFTELKKKALLENPLLDIEGLLLVKRKFSGLGEAVLDSSNHHWMFGWGGAINKGMRELGLPSNHECNSSLNRHGYDNEISILSPVHPDGHLTSLYKPEDNAYVSEVDLHWNKDRFLFTRSDSTNWKVWEMQIDGTGLRQVSKLFDDVDCFDACYLPNNRIVFGSTASYQCVPCWHGKRKVASLYLMNNDGSDIRQICYDQDHDFHPSVLNNGQIIYHRWDYTGINHIFLRQLMLMNPDGTGQRAIYGTNSWFPNNLYYPRGLPGDNHRYIAILTGYHGAHKMGQLVIIDVNKGFHAEQGLVKRLSGRNQKIDVKIRDYLVDSDWPKFLHPYPLSDKYFLVSGWMKPKGLWGIYIVDIFDNVQLILEEPGYALLEPVPVVKRKKPPIIPDRVNLSQETGTVYLHDIFAGPVLEGVPRHEVTRIRLLAYDFGYLGLAGPNKIGYGGPWEVMRILGTVPLEKDGSALFHVPANTPIAVQPLDSEGKAVQLMRSWFTVMPGEVRSCVGCHETPADGVSIQPVSAAQKQPIDITPWRGPERGFDFAREVQPVLDQYCVGCHNGSKADIPDLRPEKDVPDYKGRIISSLGVMRMHPEMKAKTGGLVKYTPAYDALLPYIRRVGIEDDVALLVPGHYHADTSELIQMLQKGHHGVELDEEAWDRLVTWIDLNAPCHGTWGDVFPIPDNMHERRMELRKHYGGPALDPEYIPPLSVKRKSFEKPKPLPGAKMIKLSGWPFDPGQKLATIVQRQKTVNLGDGIKLEMVYIPAGEFIMGSASGEPDERPMTKVKIEKPFWMGAFEITNEQYRQFKSDHNSGYYGKRHKRPDDKGLTLNEDKQPVLRINWHDAMAFCEWLSQKTQLRFTLPTEAQWEYACRAGQDTPLFYGRVNSDFSAWANMADLVFSFGQQSDGLQLTGGVEHLDLEGAAMSNTRYNDRKIVSSAVGQYLANDFGLFDMHGNVAEWTRSVYQAYPYNEYDGRNNPAFKGEKTVRGGSWFDRPERCRSAFRLSYPAWQKVFNVGFRVVQEINSEIKHALHE